MSETNCTRNVCERGLFNVNSLDIILYSLTTPSSFIIYFEQVYYETFFSLKYLSHLPAGNYMFKVNNRNSRARCEICSKLTIKLPERHYWRHLVPVLFSITRFCSSLSIINFGQLNANWVFVPTWRFIALFYNNNFMELESLKHGFQN